MTTDKFIKSYKSYNTGDTGFCRLASISAKNDNKINVIGFWYKIIRNNGKVMAITVQSDSRTKRPYRKTLLINGVSDLKFIIDDLRQNVQDDLSSFLRCPDRYKGYIQLEAL